MVRIHHGALWLVAVMAVLPQARASATEIYVDPAGGGDYTTITAAVAAAVAGDTVVVACGTYREPFIEITSDICLRSETREPECVVLDGTGTHRIMSVRYMTAGSYIEGFTFANGYWGSYWGYGGALLCQETAATIRNCVFRDNACPHSGGGAVSCDWNVRIEHCEFLGNTARMAGALYIEYGAPVLVVDCVFAGNDAVFGGAVGAYWSTTAVVERCAFVDNHASGGGALHVSRSDCTVRRCSLVGNTSGDASVSLEYSQAALVMENSIIAFDVHGAAVRCPLGGTATLSCCDLYANVGGDWTACVSGQLGVDGNISDDPLFCVPPGSDGPLTVHADSPCAASNSPCGELIGYGDVGCGSALEGLSWTAIKALYR